MLTNYQTQWRNDTAGMFHPEEFKKYTLLQDVDIERPEIIIYCITAPCPPMSAISFHAKKGDVVYGNIAQRDPTKLYVVKETPPATIYKQSDPNNKVSVAADILQPAAESTVTSIASGASSSIGNIINTTGEKVVAGIAALLLIFGFLKWQKII